MIFLKVLNNTIAILGISNNKYQLLNQNHFSWKPM